MELLVVKRVALQLQKRREKLPKEMDLNSFLNPNQIVKEEREVKALSSIFFDKLVNFITFNNTYMNLFD